MTSEKQPQRPSLPLMAAMRVVAISASLELEPSTGAYRETFRARGLNDMTHVTKQALRSEYYRLLDALDVGSPGWDTVNTSLHTFRNAAMRLSSIGERECNGVMGPDGFAKWDEADQAKADRDSEAAQRRAIAALEALFDAETFKRLAIEFQGDPRGPSITVSVVGGSQRILTAW